MDQSGDTGRPSGEKVIAPGAAARLRVACIGAAVVVVIVVALRWLQ